MPAASPVPHGWRLQVYFERDKSGEDGIGGGDAALRGICEAISETFPAAEIVENQ